ncbi:hypothetical protein [Cupriavidus sp. UYPR2.512]|uniref:hypothetical protein n=1 Tax=Cupriavidus sp. UYPR2.512 TaxID=1080187 RepID=UPI0012F9869A|nr:hypothetical protein [Cupriavidus sp. UYPR2.512]UIF89242.1 hypothetical protein KAF44_30150 [Cupriavidus necator]
MEQLHNQAAGLMPTRSERNTPAEGTLDIVQLRDRGWTRQMVARFLGNPDARRPATRGGGGRPAELYYISRVRNAERLVAFSEARRTAIERSALARRSQQERRASVLRFASNVELPLPNQPIEHIMLVVRSVERPSSQADPASDRSQAVQLLLGMLSDSSERLNVFQGQPGIRDARSLLLERKLALIASRYPALAESCENVKLEPIRENEALHLL